jgi:hypothetical protein
MNMFYRITGVLASLLSVFFLANAAIMWTGGIMLTPIGILFGIGEASNYTTMGDKLTNLFWHVFLGVAGFGYCLVFKLVAALLAWMSLKLWQRANEPTGSLTP